VGIEQPPAMLALARRRLAAAHVELRAGNAHATGLPDGGADVVTAGHAFHLEPRGDTPALEGAAGGGHGRRHHMNRHDATTRRSNTTQQQGGFQVMDGARTQRSRRGVFGTFLGTTLAVGGAVFAAACGAQAGSTGEKSPVGDAKAGGKITWSFWAVSKEQADNALNRLKEFHAQNPNIQVEAFYTEFGVYREKIVSMVSAGTPPEVTQVDAYWMPSFVQNGTIQKLDAYVKGDKTFKMDDFLPGAFMDNHHLFKGVLYGMPNGPESPKVLFYNRATWAENGLPPPDTLDEPGKWTWDTFVDHMTRVSKGTSPQRNWGINAELGVVPNPHSWIFSNSGKTLSDDLKTFVGADDRNTIEALQFQADLIHKHQVAWRPGEDLGQGDSFLSGRRAAILDGAWAAAPLFTRPDFDYGVAPLPKSPKGVRKTVVKPNSSTIPVGITGQKAATAWELVKFITSAAYQKGQIDAGQSLTNRKDQVDYFLKNSPIKNAKVFMDAYDKKEVTAIPIVPKWVEYNDQIVAEEMTKVRRGDLSVPAALGNIKMRANDILKA
jgi:ABC-type glycerol-3-phosphate transport system substrate-binding protein